MTSRKFVLPIFPKLAESNPTQTKPNQINNHDFYSLFQTIDRTSKLSRAPLVRGLGLWKAACGVLAINCYQKTVMVLGPLTL